MKNYVIMLTLCLIWFLPDASYSQDAPADVAAVPSSLPVAPAVAPEGWQYGSVMYKTKQMEWVKKAIEASEKNIPIEMALPALFPSVGTVQKSDQGIEEEIPEEASAPAEDGTADQDEQSQVELPTEAPAFYLRSILYFSPDNWTIWLNNEKISSNSEYIGELSIIKVTGNEVVFLWKDTQLDSIYPGWDSKFTHLGDNRFVSNNKNMVIDLASGDVSFILGPNQSLVTKNMQIVEGQVEASPINGGNSDVQPDEDIAAEDVEDSPEEGAPQQKAMENMTDNIMQLQMLQSVLKNNVQRLR